MEGKPRFFVIGDLHIHTNNLDETEILSRFLIDKALELDPDVIVILGDILHTNNVVRTEAQVVAVELLGALSKIAPLLVLMGNHDVPGPLSFFSKIHGFSALNYWHGTVKNDVSFPNGKGVQLVDISPVVFEVKGMKFGACPYIPPGRFEEALDMCDNWKECASIFCHQELANCDLGHGYISQSKDLWNKDLPIIISGHIHKYQKLSDNILYGGSPRQVAVNEEYYKTVGLLTFDQREDGKHVFDETRISTGLKARIQLQIIPSEVDTVEIPENGRGKIEIVGTVTENKIIRKNPRIKTWRDMGYTVKITDLICSEAVLEQAVFDENIKAGFKSLCRIRADEEGLIEEYVEVFN